MTGQRQDERSVHHVANKCRMRQFRQLSQTLRNFSNKRRRGFFAALVCAFFCAAHAGAQEPQKGPVSGLPLPRYVSLKSDRVNVREGPSKEHPTLWIYERAALPVEITAEFETWRKIRDSEGAEGWVLHSLLSGRRTALGRAVEEGAATARRRRSFDARGQARPRRHRQFAQLRRQMVPHRRQGLRRLYGSRKISGASIRARNSNSQPAGPPGMRLLSFSNAVEMASRLKGLVTTGASACASSTPCSP